MTPTPSPAPDGRALERLAEMVGDTSLEPWEIDAGAIRVTVRLTRAVVSPETVEVLARVILSVPRPPPVEIGPYGRAFSTGDFEKLNVEFAARQAQAALTALAEIAVRGEGGEQDGGL